MGWSGGLNIRWVFERDTLVMEWWDDVAFPGFNIKPDKRILWTKSDRKRR